MTDRDKAFGYAISKWGTSNTPARENLAFADGWKAALDWAKSPAPIDSAKVEDTGEAVAWKLVPVEPTDEMIHAAHAHVPEGCEMDDRDFWNACKAMIAAAPDQQRYAAGELTMSRITDDTFLEIYDIANGEFSAEFLVKARKIFDTALCIGNCAARTPSTQAVGEPDTVMHNGKDIMQIWFECNRDVFNFYDRITAPTTGSAPTVVSGPCLIVKGSGETDLPVVHIVHSLEEARHAVLSLMYSNPADAEDTDELFAEFDDTMADDNYWTIAFEIGGISVERVCLDVAASMGGDRT